MRSTPATLRKFLASFPSAKAPSRRLVGRQYLAQSLQWITDLMKPCPQGRDEAIYMMQEFRSICDNMNAIYDKIYIICTIDFLSEASFCEAVSPGRGLCSAGQPLGSWTPWFSGAHGYLYRSTLEYFGLLYHIYLAESVIHPLKPFKPRVSRLNVIQKLQEERLVGGHNRINATTCVEVQRTLSCVFCCCATPSYKFSSGSFIYLVRTAWAK